MQSTLDTSFLCLRFGVYTKRFYLITGSGCEGGRGLFIFLIENADKFQTRLFRQMKQLTLQSQHSRRATDSKQWIIEQALQKECEEFHIAETHNCWFSSEPRKKKNLIASSDFIDSALATKPRANSVNEFILQKNESNHPQPYQQRQHQYSSNILPKEISVSLAYDSDTKSSSSSWIFPDNDNVIKPNGKCMIERACQTLFDCNDTTSEHSKHSNNHPSPCNTLIRPRIQEQNSIHNNYGSQETFISETLCDQENANNGNFQGREQEVHIADENDDDASDSSEISQPLYANAEQITNTKLNAKFSNNQMHNEKLSAYNITNEDETVVTSCSMNAFSPITTMQDSSSLSLSTLSSSTSSSPSFFSNKPINTFCSYMKNWRLGRSIEPIAEKEEQASRTSSISLGNEELNIINKEECDGLVSSSTPDNDVNLKEINNEDNSNLKQLQSNKDTISYKKSSQDNVHSTGEVGNSLEDVKFYRLVSRSATWDGWMKLTTNTKKEIHSQKVIVKSNAYNSEATTATNGNTDITMDSQSELKSDIIVMTAF
uniref:IRS-type PTB domain-containing protein n=1 Tax=Trichobilharzia regenti TaxID=157069 RepID=A0AA85KAF2_TRIRE|nr:unnamed protein product [Trichobilharzia regenti]